jgi:hypothetical protein
MHSIVLGDAGTNVRQTRRGRRPAEFAGRLRPARSRRGAVAGSGTPDTPLIPYIGPAKAKAPNDNETVSPTTPMFATMLPSAVQSSTVPRNMRFPFVYISS